MEAHVSKLSELFEKLNNLQPEKILDDQWLVAILFSSLPEEYETLVPTLEARPENDLTLDMVKGKLIDEWQKKKQRNDDSDNPEAVLYANSKAEKDRCFFCKNLGHQKANCEKFRVWKAEKGNGAVSKHRKAVSKQQKANHVSQQDDDDDSYAFLTGCNSQAEDQWILDSGATCHIANYRNFEDLDDAATEDVWVANGYVRKAEVLGE
ncbi:uncharacterized protein LOC135702887 [Ochlerotatus camptorhynchus]|uniref:uncharacterized protein LOC135702887 n=1 Tax=Ochlerotatus camptorhynchus TaxID=644619 RepID=UPI0031D0B6B1